MSFKRFLKKSLWNHFKKSETFTNRSGLKNQYQRWVSCTLFVGRMTISLKNIEIFKRNTIFQGADFRNFRNLDFWTFDHCILYSFLRGFSLWQRRIDSTTQMMVYDQITYFIKMFDFFFFFDFFEDANLPKIPIKPGDSY